jgi:hypothetical protein
MKLPIQSQPVLRNISTARISYGSSMVHPQEGCKTILERFRDCKETYSNRDDRPGLIGCRLGATVFCAANPDLCEPC